MPRLFPFNVDIVVRTRKLPNHGQPKVLFVIGIVVNCTAKNRNMQSLFNFDQRLAIFQLGHP